MPIPEGARESWDFVWAEVVDVHAKWKLHEQMFARGQKRLDLLLETSANFFGTIQEMLLMSIQMTVSKLVDNASTGAFDNMSLKKLAVELAKNDPNTDEAAKALFVSELDIAINTFVSGSKDMRNRRNKFLAHLDYDVALNLRPEPLLSVTRAEIESVLESLRAVMKKIESYFTVSSTAYGQPVLTWDADLLVEALKRGLRYSELEKEGVVPYFDWKKSPWADA